jgi:hypothetical protein
LDLGVKVLAPWFMNPFDERGVCTAPQTFASLQSTAKTGGFTDLLLFSHGWNNDWADACDAYRRFIKQFAQLRPSFGVEPGEDYRPLLVGVFWPSISLVLP